MGRRAGTPWARAIGVVALIGIVVSALASGAESVNSNPEWDFVKFANKSAIRSMIAAIGNNLLLAGGALWNGSGWNLKFTVQRYSPSADAWTDKANMPQGLMEHAMASLNGVAYVIGGDTGNGQSTAATRQYNPGANVWTTLAGIPARTGQQYRSTRSASAAGVKGKVYLAGGQDSQGNILNTLLRYDPVADKWDYMANMPMARYQLAVAASDDKLYAIGGRDGEVIATSTLFEYDPDLDSWSTKAPMPGGGRSMMSAVVLRGKLYVVGGENNNNNKVSTVEMYNPDTDSWTSLPDYPIADGKGAYDHIIGATADDEVAYFVVSRLYPEDMSVSTSTLRLTSPTPTPIQPSGSGPGSNGSNGSNVALIGGIVGGVALLASVAAAIAIKRRRALYRQQAARLTMARASASPSLASV